MAKTFLLTCTSPSLSALKHDVWNGRQSSPALKHNFWNGRQSSARPGRRRHYDVHGIKAGSPVPATLEVIKQPNELLGKELKAFLHSLNYDLGTAYAKYGGRDVYVESIVNHIFDDEVTAGRISHEERVRVGKLIPCCCRCARCYYFQLPPEVKVIPTLITVLGILVEDLCKEDPTTIIPEIQRTIRNWGSVDESHGVHGHIAHLQRVATIEVPKYYGPVAAAIISRGIMDFLVGCIMENWIPKGIACPPTSSRFPEYLRTKTGGGELYAFLLFPEKMFPEANFLEIYLPAIPDVAHFASRINDIMSYYKESLDEGDENTYMKTMSRALGCSAFDVMRSSCESQLALIPEITATLSQREELLQAWLGYQEGYILWHLLEKRYRLEEIGIQLPAE